MLQATAAHTAGRESIAVAAAGNHALRVKRVYEAPAAEDGRRVLVDGLWPRGISREKARIDIWLREVAPSAELRRWYGKDAARWPAFRERYLAELRERPEAANAVAELQRMRAEGPLTLLFAKRDTEHNNAVVLQELLEGQSAA